MIEGHTDIEKLKRRIYYLEKELQQKNIDYELIFQEMNAAFALHEMIFDQDGKPVDYRFIRVNNAFEKYTGLKNQNIAGKTVLEVMPNTEKYWIEKYGEVAITGKPIEFEEYASELEKYYIVKAFSPKKKFLQLLFLM